MFVWSMQPPTMDHNAMCLFLLLSQTVVVLVFVRDTSAIYRRPNSRSF